MKAAIRKTESRLNTRLTSIRIRYNHILKAHLTTWCYLNGGGWIEVDATTLMHPTVTQHREAPPADQRITPEQGLQQARFAMAQRKETEVYDNALDALSKAVETLRDEKKQRAKAARRKRKRQAKKKRIQKTP